MPTIYINEIEAGTPLIGRPPPNFRPKEDRKAIKPLVKKRGDREQEEQPGRPRAGEELDRYI